MVLSPIKAIKAKCLDCSCHSKKAVRSCHITDCSLYPFRMGKNPNRKGIKKTISTQEILFEVPEPKGKYPQQSF